MLVVEVDVVELELELEPVTVSDEPAMRSDTVLPLRSESGM